MKYLMLNTERRACRETGEVYEYVTQNGHPIWIDDIADSLVDLNDLVPLPESLESVCRPASWAGHARKVRELMEARIRYAETGEKWWKDEDAQAV